MKQFAVAWNLGREILSRSGYLPPDEPIRRRGYSREVNLRGELRLFLKDNPKATLSVTDIAGGVCPQFIDAYLEKSPFSPLRNANRRKQLNTGIQRGSYQQLAGNLFEDVLAYARSIEPKSREVSYDDFRKKALNDMSSLQQCTRISLETFRSSRSAHPNGGDPDWFIGQLEYFLAFERMMSQAAIRLQKRAKGPLQTENMVYSKKVLTDHLALGVRESVPDFFAAKDGLVGDIKTGQRFQYKFLLTCAGYALALESKRHRKVDWGAIVFEPNEACPTTMQPFVLPQVYIFAITEELRRDFLERRDQIYAQNKSQSLPPQAISQAQFHASENCTHCKYLQVCHEEYGITVS
jgi:CRISPR/Cas system-associated exonuclease Cas4 (RecB family)